MNKTLTPAELGELLLSQLRQLELEDDTLDVQFCVSRNRMDRNYEAGTWRVFVGEGRQIREIGRVKP